ncbi:MAG TPA: hypothetical protein VGJ57_05160 [Nitrospirales bacterium]|jgi:hypothetical protein
MAESPVKSTDKVKRLVLFPEEVFTAVAEIAEGWACSAAPGENESAMALTEMVAEAGLDRSKATRRDNNYTDTTTGHRWHPCQRQKRRSLCASEHGVLEKRLRGATCQYEYCTQTEMTTDGDDPLK